MEPEYLINVSYSMKERKLGWIPRGVISAFPKAEWRLLLSYREVEAE